MDDLRGKTFVITGAASGLGRASAARLVEAGANTLLADMDEDGLAQVAAELDSHADQLDTLRLDVRQADQCATAAQQALKRFGAHNGAVCSAGIDTIFPFLEMSLADWQRVIDVNLTGTFLTVQATARAMVESGNQGALVTFASGIAVRGRGAGAHYAASKGGVIALSKSAALDLARHKIRVNVVAPGMTDTPMAQNVITPEEMAARARQVPLGRIAQPDDIAKVVEFLVSDASGWLTGQTLHANGGLLMP
jgi:NAD(P)-dependent dehydrogenase (short-subunit alcohol dehydrogenase family)